MSSEEFQQRFMRIIHEGENLSGILSEILEEIKDVSLDLLRLGYAHSKPK
ncbi:MAG: hypothetical protein GPJ51_01805, partial [Candidatus Heimdallarchaeota archaeon]|nr:hypothetical protein [Candidatus Heimdallarchaeota archaeon]